MKKLFVGLMVALLWGQNSPSWGRAQVDSARSIIPAYIVSPVAQPTTRLPYFAVLRITGLEPNTWYRYVPRMDNATTPPTTNNVNLGAGNPIFYNPQSQTYRLVTNVGFSTAGGYDTLLTDSDGEALLVFGIQPTGNARFRTDGGNKLYVKVFLRTHQSSTPVDSAYVIGSHSPVQPLALRTTCPSPDTCGSFLYDSTLTFPGGLVFLYQGYGPHEWGERPLTGAVVENVGISWGNSQLPAYVNEVSGRALRYGTLIPNISTGVRAIHYVDPDRPELYCSEALFDLDGVWPSGVSTVTPSNGPAALGLLNSPRYPLLPDPGNSCLTVTSASINTSTGSIYVGYTIQSTEGFLYGVTTRLPGGPECESGLLPFNLPPNLVQADSVAPTMPYVYALCSPDDWGSQLDSLDGFLWPPSSTAFSPAPCEPCNWYNPVEGTFYWRCFRGEGGYVVNNFTYQGEVNPIPDFFQSVTVNLSPRRVPDKVRLISVPSNLVSPGTSFILSAELVDSLTPATWGQFGSPNFSSCSFTTATLHILTAGGASVSSHTASVQAGSGGAPTMQFTGTWPLTPGQYKVVVEGLPFPTCGCGAAPTSGWRASDTLLVEVGMSTTLSMEVRSEGNLWAVSLPQAEGQLLLYDSQGRLVWRGGAALRVGIPRDLLSPGLYTLVWQSSKEVISRKLLHISP